MREETRAQKERPDPVTFRRYASPVCAMSSSERQEAALLLSEAVEALRSGKVSFVEGVRKVLSLRHPLGVEDFDPDFMVLVAVDSESDHLPNAYARSVASPAWLAESDREEKELREQSGSVVMAACARLVARFGEA